MPKKTPISSKTFTLHLPEPTRNTTVFGKFLVREDENGKKYLTERAIDSGEDPDLKIAADNYRLSQAQRLIDEFYRDNPDLLRQSD